MKYQKPLAIVGGIAIAVGLAIWIRRGLIESANENAKAVTSTATGGQSQTKLIKTTPIQTSDVAFVAPANPLKLIADIGGRVLQRVGSLVLPSHTDVLQPQGNPVSARAAYTSPIRPDYAPTPYANLKPR